ncbi:MAG: hypothetical protein GY716_11570 [bacterium]|nr:hypothetical protein [bacterium]
MNALRMLLVAAFGLVGALPASASVGWDGEAGNGLWSDPLNWSGDVVPASTDAITISGNAGTVHLDVDHVFDGMLTLGSASSTDLDELVIDPGVTATIPVGIGITITISGALRNEGRITLEAGGDLYVNAGRLDNVAGGRIDGHSNARIFGNSDLAHLTNAGDWSGTQLRTTRGTMTNTGMLDVPIVGVSFGGFTLANEIGGTLRLSGSQTLTVPLVLVNQGSVVNDATVTLDGEFTNDGALDNSVGTFHVSCGAVFRGGGIVLGNPVTEECKSWDGDAGNGLWSDPLNWSLDTTPAGTDRIFIDGQDAAVAVRLDADFTIDHRLDLEGWRTGGVDDDTLTIDAGVSLTNHGVLHNQRFEIIIDGTLINTGTLLNDGHPNIAPARITNSGTIVNSGLIDNQNAATLTNNGTIDNQGAIDNSCDGTIDGSGTLTGAPVFEECIVWDGEADNGLWSDPLNWDSDALPVSDNDVSITGGAGEVHLDTDFTVANLLLVGIGGATSTLVVDPGVTLTLQANLAVTVDGALRNDGTITNHSSLQGNAGSIVNGPGALIDGFGTIQIGGDQATFTNHGTIDGGFLSASRGTLVNDGLIIGRLRTSSSTTALIVNTVDGVLTGTNQFQIRHADDVIENFGMITCGGGTADENRGTIENRGTLQVLGTLTNWSLVENFGAIDNGGSYFNRGATNNRCGGQIGGNPFGFDPPAEILCVPDPTSPADGATLADDTPSFGWQNPTELRPVSYEWWIEDVTAPGVPVQSESIVSLGVSLSTPLVDGTYDWRVRATLDTDPAVVSEGSVAYRLTVACQVDGDGDGFVACADCDDTNLFRYPGAPELCDGVDNNCDDVVPSWDTDSDGDGLSACAGDCDELNPATYPGAPETNDGEDNQCPGEPGAGLVDEVTGPLVFGDPRSKTRLSWLPQSGATGYQLLRAVDLNYANCGFLSSGTEAFVDDSVAPLPGEMFLYLVRSTGPSVGSWGADSAGTERMPICAP